MNIPGLKTTDTEGWANHVLASDKSPWGSGAIQFAVDWSKLMDLEISEDMTNEDFAEMAERTTWGADKGYTGFMHDLAIVALSKFWVHGERLRLWHNKRTQRGAEGDRANATPGTVIMSSIISVGDG